jgi:hypothetical protein
MRIAVVTLFLMRSLARHNMLLYDCEPSLSIA